MVTPPSLTTEIAATLEEYNPHKKINPLVAVPLPLTFGVARRCLSGIDNNHPLYILINESLLDLKEHAEAFEVLGEKSKAAAIHARKLEESVSVLIYIIQSPDDWVEYAWRWKNNAALALIVQKLRRNGSVDKPNPTSGLREWYRNNQFYIGKYVKTNLTGDIEKDTKALLSIHHWLSPKTYKKIFDAVDNLESYEVSFYNWYSSSTHLAPNNHFLVKRDSVFGSFYEESRMHINLRVSRFLNALADIAKTTEAQQSIMKTSGFFALNTMYRIVRVGPEEEFEYFKAHESIRNLIVQCMKDKTIRIRLLNAVSNKPKK